MKVRSISASISVIISYIWTKFGTELKHDTINTPEWWNSHSLKNPRWRPPPSWIFRLCEKKNVNNSRLDKDICIKFYGIMHWTLSIIYSSISRRGGYEAARHRTDTESPRLLQCCSCGTSSVDPSTTATSTECRCSSRLWHQTTWSYFPRPCTTSLATCQPAHYIQTVPSNAPCSH